MRRSYDAAASVILPEGDEPFGDVFGESPETAQWTAAASDEDSPFGLPEPPPPPPAPAPRRRSATRACAGC